MQAEALIQTQSASENEALSRQQGFTSRAPVVVPVTSAVLDVTCTARPGLLDDIRRVLEGSQATFADLVSRQFDAPMDSTTVFHAAARLSVTNDCDLDALQSDLEAIEPDLIVSLVALLSNRTDLSTIS